MYTGRAAPRARPLLLVGLIALVVLALVSVAAVVALSRVRVLDEQRLTDRVVDIRLWSPALRGRTTVRLLLPAAYADRPEARDADRWAAHKPYDLAPRPTAIPLFVSVGDGRPGPLNPGGTEDPTEPYLETENWRCVNA